MHWAELCRFKKANLFCSLEHSISLRHWVLIPPPDWFTAEMRDGETTSALKCTFLWAAERPIQGMCFCTKKLQTNMSASFYLLTLIVMIMIPRQLINKMCNSSNACVPLRLHTNISMLGTAYSECGIEGGLRGKIQGKEVWIIVLITIFCFYILYTFINPGFEISATEIYPSTTNTMVVGGVSFVVFTHMKMTTKKSLSKNNVPISLDNQHNTLSISIGGIFSSSTFCSLGRFTV